MTLPLFRLDLPVHVTPATTSSRRFDRTCDDRKHHVPLSLGALPCSRGNANLFGVQPASQLALPLLQASFWAGKPYGLSPSSPFHHHTLLSLCLLQGRRVSRDVDENQRSHRSLTTSWHFSVPLPSRRNWSMRCSIQSESTSRSAYLERMRHRVFLWSCRLHPQVNGEPIVCRPAGVWVSASIWRDWEGEDETWTADRWWVSITALH